MQDLQESVDVVEEEAVLPPLIVPPCSYEEFIKLENLEEWPVRLMSEMMSDLMSEMDFIKSPQEMHEALENATDVSFYPMDELDSRVSQFDKELSELANRFVQPKAPVEEIAFSVRYKMTDTQRRNYESKRVDPLAPTRLLQLKSQSVEYCSFPGFAEKLHLPSGIYTKDILQKIADITVIPPKCQFRWKKIFVSRISNRVFEDIFWMVFLNHFGNAGKTENSEILSTLFDRLAGHFVEMFIRVSSKLKDSFFYSYPDALSQAIFLTLNEAFPESKKLFTKDDFKQEFINQVHQWITGIKPRPNSFDQWDYGVLEGSMIENDPNNASTRKSLTQKVMEATVSMVDPTTVKMDAAGFEKNVHLMEAKVIDTQESSAQVVVPKFQSISTNAKVILESHPIGPGAEMTQSDFDLYSKSTLIKHYFVLHGDKSHDQSENQLARLHQSISRREILKYPPKNRETYQQYLKRKQEEGLEMRSQHDKIISETERETARIAAKRLDLNRRIIALQGELMQLRNPLDIKAMANYIKDMDLD